MRRSPVGWVHRLVLLTAVVGSLLILVEAPLAHVMSGARPAASDPTVPTEEERTEVAGVSHVRVQVRTRHQAVYQETVASEPNRVAVRRSPFPSRRSPIHRSFAGAALPLRC